MGAGRRGHLGESCLAERLGRHVRLTRAEREALDRLAQQPRVCRRGSVVISENERARDLYIVQDGWLHSGVLLHNGGRQIMRFLFPGDIIGFSVLPFGESTETVIAVTDAVLCPFARGRLGVLFDDHPRLGALILTLAAADRAALGDRTAAIGRLSARGRVASVLCEIFARIRELEGRRSDEAVIPLTQEDIGDATGLTAVHVNRMMRALADDRMIERSGSRVRLLDEARLAEEANFIDRARIDLGWLPAPR